MNLRIITFISLLSQVQLYSSFWIFSFWLLYFKWPIGLIAFRRFWQISRGAEAWPRASLLVVLRLFLCFPFHGNLFLVTLQTTERGDAFNDGISVVFFFKCQEIKHLWLVNIIIRHRHNDHKIFCVYAKEQKHGDPYHATLQTVPMMKIEKFCRWSLESRSFWHSEHVLIKLKIMFDNDMLADLRLTEK